MATQHTPQAKFAQYNYQTGAYNAKPVLAVNGANNHMLVISELSMESAIDGLIGTALLAARKFAWVTPSPMVRRVCIFYTKQKSIMHRWPKTMGSDADFSMPVVK